MTMVIADEFREKVNKAARSVAGSSSAVDWEDVSQDMWVWMLENPKQYDDYAQLEDPFKQLKKIAKQQLHRANNAWEWYSGNYTYTPGEVRGLLSEYLLDVSLESVSEHVDLVEGMLELRNEASGYFKSIIDKWVHGKDVNSGSINKAVDKLTILMNQVNKAARYSYEGPGSRKALTNTQAISKKEVSWG